MAAPTPRAGRAATGSASVPKGRESGKATRRRLLSAALATFASKGYEATTTREIAAAAGVTPGALYVHYASKEAMLFQISSDGHEQTLSIIQAASDGPGDAIERLRSAMYGLALWHAEHKTVAQVGQEFRALSDEHRQSIAGLRRKTNAVMCQIIEAGRDDGAFDVDDVTGTALALWSLAIDVARWYDPADKRRSPSQIATLYSDLAVRMVAKHSSPSKAKRRTT